MNVAGARPNALGELMTDPNIPGVIPSISCCRLGCQIRTRTRHDRSARCHLYRCARRCPLSSASASRRPSMGSPTNARKSLLISTHLQWISCHPLQIRCHGALCFTWSGGNIIVSSRPAIYDIALYASVSGSSVDVVIRRSSVGAVADSSKLS